MFIVYGINYTTTVLRESLDSKLVIFYFNICEVLALVIWILLKIIQAILIIFHIQYIK